MKKVLATILITMFTIHFCNPAISNEAELPKGKPPEPEIETVVEEDKPTSCSVSIDGEVSQWRSTIINLISGCKKEKVIEEEG